MTFPAGGGCTDRRGFWGLPRDVERVVGVPVGRLARGKRASKCWESESRGWSAQYFPSGNVLFRTWVKSVQSLSTTPLSATGRTKASYPKAHAPGANAGKSDIYSNPQ